MFIAMGLSAVFPVIHGMELYGLEDMRDRMGLFWVVLQGFLYILGAVLYAVRHFVRRKSYLADRKGSLAREKLAGYF